MMNKNEIAAKIEIGAICLKQKLPCPPHTIEDLLQLAYDIRDGRIILSSPPFNPNPYPIKETWTIERMVH